MLILNSSGKQKENSAKTGGMTTLEVKKINKTKVYELIYSQRSLSKQAIAEKLRMSLTTVTQNLKVLEEEGLIEKKGVYESTGGRKPQVIRIVRDARIALGVELLKEMAQITAIDLYGESIESRTLPLPFSPSEAYCRTLGEAVRTFAGSLPLPSTSVLGVGLAIQGVASPDGRTVTYGKLLGCTGMSLEDFSRFLPWPCRLEHDSKATAAAELYHMEDKRDSVMLILNRNLGGALIIGDSIHQGLGRHSGAVEHLCLDPHGPLCYCGKRGCLETYCSADSLLKQTGEDVNQFFRRLRSGEPEHGSIWNAYLEHLAFAIRNLNMILDCQVILGGFLSLYFTKEDVEQLTLLTRNLSPFPLGEEAIRLSGYGQLAPAIGAALYYVEDFIRRI